jgi:hypothetical protein
VPWQGQHAARKGPTMGVFISRLGRSSSLSSYSPGAVAMASSSHILLFPVGLLLDPVGLLLGPVGLFQRRFTPSTGADTGLAPTPHPAGKPCALNGDVAHGEACLLPDPSLPMGFVPHTVVRPSHHRPPLLQPSSTASCSPNKSTRPTLLLRPSLARSSGGSLLAVLQAARAP